MIFDFGDSHQPPGKGIIELAGECPGVALDNLFFGTGNGPVALFSLVLLLDGFCVVSGVFTIPLGGGTEEPPVSPTGDSAGQMVLSRTSQHYVGSSENRLVEAAINTLFSTADGDGPIDSINPMVFFGPAGSGKSLLALGASARWQAQYPSDEVITITGVDLLRRLAESIQVNGVGEFTLRLAEASLLVIDDLHVVASRGTAEEFLCGILDGRCAASLPTLVSLDQSPACHDRLSQRLAGRLLTGLSVPLAIPGESALKLILIQLAARADLETSDLGCRLLLAGKETMGAVFQTPRQLRQAVLWIAAEGYSLIDDDSARAALEHFLQARRPTLKLISSMVGRRFTVTLGQLQGPSRKQAIVRARSAAMWLAKQHSGLSYVQIGRFFGGRDHSTVIHACRRVEEKVGKDQGFQLLLAGLDQELNQSLSIE